MALKIILNRYSKDQGKDLFKKPPDCLKNYALLDNNYSPGWSLMKWLEKDHHIEIGRMIPRNVGDHDTVNLVREKETSASTRAMYDGSEGEAAFARS